MGGRYPTVSVVQRISTSHMWEWLILDTETGSNLTEHKISSKIGPKKFSNKKKFMGPTFFPYQLILWTKNHFD